MAAMFISIAKTKKGRKPNMTQVSSEPAADAGGSTTGGRWFGMLCFDDAGNRSSMRAMSCTAFVVAIVGGVAIGFTEAFWPDVDLESAEEIVKWLLGAAFGPKAVQKFAEAKSMARPNS